MTGPVDSIWLARPTATVPDPVPSGGAPLPEERPADDPAAEEPPADELRATADELDALAWVLARSSFPCLPPTLVSAVPEESRSAVAGRLLQSLLLRGVIAVDEIGPHVAPRYGELLGTVLEPDVAIVTHVRTPDSSATAVACQRGGTVLLHRQDAEGAHVLATVDGSLDSVLAALVDLPVAPEPVPEAAAVRLRYRALLRHLENDEDSGRLPATADPFVSALTSYTRVAKLTRVSHRSGTYTEQVLVVVAAPEGQWAAVAEPDDTDAGNDGWLYAEPVRPGELADRLVVFCR